MHQILTIVALVAVADAQVSLRDGTELNGQIKALGSETIVVQSSDSEKELNLNKIRQIRFSHPEEVVAPKSVARVNLTDGTEFAVKNVSTTKDVATLSLAAGGSLQVPTRSVHFARFGSQNEKLDAQWKEILETKLEGDAIVIRRPEHVVNFLEGVVGDITDAHVRFQYDEEWSDVRREKVDGVVYFALNRPVFPPAKCIVTTLAGSRIHVETMTLEAKQLEIATTNKSRLQLPLASVRQIEFARSDTDFLSDLEMDYKWEPDLPLPQLSSELEQLNRPSVDKSLFGKKLAIAMEKNGLQIREFNKGLAAHSRTEITYRLAGEYRRFQAWAGIDEQIIPHGKLKLIIMGDDRTLYEKMISGTDAAHAVDLELIGVRRMKIIVDFGDKSGLGDHLNLCDARLSK